MPYFINQKQFQSPSYRQGRSGSQDRHRLGGWGRKGCQGFASVGAAVGHGHGWCRSERARWSCQRKPPHPASGTPAAATQPPAEAPRCPHTCHSPAANFCSEKFMGWLLNSTFGAALLEMHMRSGSSSGFGVGVGGEERKQRGGEKFFPIARSRPRRAFPLVNTDKHASPGNL